MMRSRKSGVAFLSVLGGFIIPVVISLSLTYALAADSREARGFVTESVTSDGVVDWTSGVVRATGIGFPSAEAGTTLQAKQMARRAALGVAQRNLLEAIGAVRVDSVTLVNNYIVKSDEIRSSISGLVDNAKVVNERELEKGAYEITLEMKLTGKTSGMFLPKDSPKPTRLSSSQSPLEVKPRGRAYTGLVVDARGTGLVPAMAPRILNEDGIEAYSQTYVQPAKLTDQGIVAYVPDMPSAEANPRVTNYPLVVKAVKIANSGRSDLVISNADAQTIHGVPEHFQFLEKGQVIIVIDGSAKQH
jgi:hypothetical protein